VIAACAVAFVFETPVSFVVTCPVLLYVRIGQYAHDSISVVENAAMGFVADSFFVIKFEMSVLH
jgi:hypothetical protein